MIRFRRLLRDEERWLLRRRRPDDFVRSSRQNALESVRLRGRLCLVPESFVQLFHRLLHRGTLNMFN
jgi:hypothetical protein